MEGLPEPQVIDLTNRIKELEEELEYIKVSHKKHHIRKCLGCEEYRSDYYSKKAQYCEECQANGSILYCEGCIVDKCNVCGIQSKQIKQYTDMLDSRFCESCLVDVCSVCGIQPKLIKHYMDDLDSRLDKMFSSK